MTDVSFKERAVLITGAGRGLGLAYARCIGQLGATILLHDIGANSDGDGSDPRIAEDAVSVLRAEGIEARAFHQPIDTGEGCHALVAEAHAVRGRLDAIIHNAGWVAYEPVDRLSEAAFDNMMAVTAKAPLWMVQAAWPHMTHAGFGRIVLTSSCRALYPQYVQKGLGSYVAAKMAVVGLANVLALEGEEHGIVVNTVSPVAKTRMWGVDGEPEELKPAAVAPGVAFLASEACTEGGWILRAANGQFHATRMREAEGVDYPEDLRAVAAASPASVAASWNEIAVATPEARG